MTQQEEFSISIGIDLGLTHSSVAYYDIVRNEPIILQDKTGKEQIPSCVNLSQLNSSGFAVVGNVAKYDINNKCIIYDSKKIIGRDEIDVDYEDYPFEVKGRDNGSAYIECYNPLTQESEEFEPEEISGMILKYLYETAQEKLGNHPISNVIVTVPAEFNDRQREATLLACKLAGIKNVELANELIAVIIEYKREYPNSLKNGDKIVVIDFGRTLDVTCCKIVNDNIIVDSSGGNENLGFNDIDKVMSDIIKERIEEGIPGYYEQKQGMTQEEKITLNKKIIRLKKESERIKIELSDKNDTELDLELLLLSDDYEFSTDFTITRKEFEEECYKRGIYEEFINKIKQVTQRKGYKKRNVKLVILNSGICKIPRIREEVTKLFDIQTFADESFNPLNAVVKGAAYLAFSKQETVIGHEVVYDIVPTPIGIEVKGGTFKILIKDGEKLPTNIITKRYSTTKLNQTSIKFNIYKGFGKCVNSYKMEYITTLCIDRTHNGKSREQIIEFTMQINEKGVMNICGSVIGTDIKKEMHVNIDLSRENGETAKLIKHFQSFY
ncbi:heat shock cognate HSP70 protein, putative [Entamoeba dispar SAW760]|uniref:Heat shock cognate HSP70 protein, putative n=1 Tax=Entamoeba dispar (strain ATCC PRA-260 / SAW760) TaxID=370354 RepID=B0EGC1_ENTDS|nr:heat shock cognate HSP70 protein, putative [Entamoeba dispar SAW760]EDR26423.1 heat shock cognate HSP70 protein, putative [Entamoeba dispar SAW760]|eukprot:EDR26423.1 heat shock cognate HSP70 protein, putative [Entamoeba dispar SAW760]